VRANLGSTPVQEAPPPAVGRILDSGIFDKEYYEVQRGRSFDSLIDAVRDFVRVGHREGMSPHPLLEPEWVLGERPRQRPNAVIQYLEGAAGGAGPLFDDSVYRAHAPEADPHPGGALGRFLVDATDADVLPAPSGRFGGQVTLGEARQVALESARRHAHDEALRSVERRGRWDESRDAAFLAEWRGRPHDRLAGTPAVTVVMPVRNRRDQVLEAIASVQAQSFDDWELVVVDDGSTDDTPDRIERVAAEDARIRLVRAEATGVSAARNAGIERARGRWLAFLDSDNTWVPYFLEVMVAGLDGQGLQAGHAIVDTGPDSSEGADRRHLCFDGGLEHLLVRNHIDLNALMVRTSVVREIGGFDEELRRWVDHDLAIRIARRVPIPLVPFVAVHYDHSNDAPDRITTTEPDYWELVVLGKNHVDWNAVTSGVAEREPGLVSVCVATVGDWTRTRRAVDAVLAEADRNDAAPAFEVVLLVNGSRRSVEAILRASYAGEQRVRFVTLPRNMSFGISANVLFGASRGETVVFLDNDTEVLDGWLEALVAPLADPAVSGAQALLLHPDGSVQHAGWAFPGGGRLPSPFLAGLPVDDAAAASPIELRAICASALAVRATDFARWHGFDPRFDNGWEDVDLCLRVGESEGGRFVVADRARVVHHQRPVSAGRLDRHRANNRTFLTQWGDRARHSDLDLLARLGYRVPHFTAGPAHTPDDVRIPVPALTRIPRTIESGPRAGEAVLRWALKTSVPLRHRGTSSELELAERLAGQLTALGQDVVIDRLETHQRASGHLDDIALAFRGGSPVHDEPGAINLAWLLESGPALSVHELLRYDGLVTLDGRGATWWSNDEAAEARASLLEVAAQRPDDAALAALAEVLLDHALDLRRRRDDAHDFARS